jgi:hypothetical protein
MHKTPSREAKYGQYKLTLREGFYMEKYADKNYGNEALVEAAEELACINVADCTGGCNEIKAAADAWLDDRTTSRRLYAAAKANLVKDNVCGCHKRDDLLNCVVNELAPHN